MGIREQDIDLVEEIIYNTLRDVAEHGFASKTQSDWTNSRQRNE